MWFRLLPEDPSSQEVITGTHLIIECDLSLDVDRPLFKRNNLRFEASTYFQSRVRLPDNLRRQIERERDKVDRDTI